MRVMNTFLPCFIYKKYSQVILEGDSVTIFGIMRFNIYSGGYEMEKPIAFMKGSKVDLLSTITSWKVGNYLWIGCLGACISGCTYGLFKSIAYIVKKLRTRYSAMVLDQLQEIDIEQ